MTNSNKLQKVSLIGAKGRMGKQIVDTIAQSDFCEISTTSENKPLLLDLGDDITDITPQNTDIVIEFTVAGTGSYENITKLLQNGNKSILIGTSGWSNTEIDRLKAFLQEQSISDAKIFIVPNFSISAVLQEKWAIEAAKHFNDANIIEYHHKAKLDKPSGTARRLQEVITENNGEKSGETPEISSIRGDGYMATQDVIFTNFGERLVITQDVMSREAFMPGVLMALRGLSELEYGITVGLGVLL